MLAATALPALAHPHIFIDAKTRIVFDNSGAVSEIHNTWTFDEAYSAWAVQGLDANNDGKLSPDEFQDLADDNLKGLSEYEFYTFAGEGDFNLKFFGLPGPHITYDGKQATLDFGVKPETPYHIKKTLELAINDPEYYVSITFADASTVTLENAPPGCSARLDPPKEMPDAIADELYALPADVTQLPPDLEKAVRGVQGAILVDCPSDGAAVVTPQPAAPATALDAVNQIAAVKAAPFDGPPPEQSFLPTTGPFKWIADGQREFYAMLTASMARLKTDYTAFWVLGLLSFAYGVVHAAGPGHGKVVIGSYLLANESKVRRGILLSFASAMVQSTVAVAFVLVAASVLNMTAMSMSNAANWVVIVSYALIALLGLYLIVRRLFGWGHHHHHAKPARGKPKRDRLRRKAHAHLHGEDVKLDELEHLAAAHEAFKTTHVHDHHGHEDHDHHDHDHHGDDHHDHAHHVVTADQIRGGWREQLGVVLAIGMRPCSGALVVLVFALSQGLLAAGIVSVFLMGVGTALTVAVLATLAVVARDMARRLLGAGGGMAGKIMWWLELVGGIVVFAFGATFLIASFV
ncbi:MAG TPA: DUF1007 family protein [Devosiaceae bacterium]